ncbi:hypothetical protein PMIN02_012891 [Paraphaeosphaeria minitans]
MLRNLGLFKGSVLSTFLIRTIPTSWADVGNQFWMVVLHLNGLMLHSVRVDTDSRELRVLFELLLTGQDAGGHAVDAFGAYTAVVDSFSEVLTPVSAVWHDYVQPSTGGRNSRVVRTPVAYDETFKPKFGLQRTIEKLRFLAAVRVVGFLIRTHGAGCTLAESVCKRKRVRLVDGTIVHIAQYSIAQVALSPAKLFVEASWLPFKFRHQPGTYLIIHPPRASSREAQCRHCSL